MSELEFVDNFKFDDTDLVYHISEGNTRYWIIFNTFQYKGDDKIFNKYNEIWRVKVHENECCELFTHSILKLMTKTFTRSKFRKLFSYFVNDSNCIDVSVADSDYDHLIYKVLKSNLDKLGNYKFLDTNKLVSELV